MSRSSSSTELVIGDRLKAVPIACLRADSDPNFDIYIQPKEGVNPVLYRERHLTFSEEVLMRLINNQIDTVYVDREQWPSFQHYVEENLGHVLSDPTIDKGKKAELLYDSAQGLMEEVLEDPRSGDLILRSRELVKHATPFLKSEKGALEELIRVASFDYYTYTHSVNVFMFSNALARQVGVSDDLSLRELGVGTLLHDIGKSRLDPEVVNCRGKLNDEQWHQMKMHPVWGHEIALEHGSFSPMSLDIIRHHHEKLDGSGYPDQLRGRQIPSFTRIATICDIFDALTTKRVYKDALNSFPALKLMRDEMVKEIDQELFFAFVNMMANPDDA